MKHLIPEFEKWKKRFPPGFDSAMVMLCVRRIQDDRGFVADSDIDGLAGYLGVPRMQIEEVLSYYTQFRREAVGRWHVQACRNVTCSMRSAEKLIDHLAKKIGVAPGNTTADGRFTLSTVECLGSCGTAPVVMINDTYHENMSIEKLDELLEGLK